jgi:hypothetical protein
MDDAIKGARRPILPCGYLHGKFWQYLLRHLFAYAVNTKFGPGTRQYSPPRKIKRSHPASALFTRTGADYLPRHPVGHPSGRPTPNPPRVSRRPAVPAVKPSGAVWAAREPDLTGFGDAQRMRPRRPP